MHCFAMRVRGAVPLTPQESPRVGMAIYSFRMQVIGRSAGRSATAAAAYRSGEQLTDERTGQVHDYSGKSDIYASEIWVPQNAPERLSDRATLWNEVERGEKRKDSQLCNEIMIALPVELSHEQKQTLTREYVQDEFVSQGMIADIGYHDFDSHNPHAHIMLTMRPVNEEGFGKKKRQWNKRDAVKEYRADWAEYANRALEQAGFEERIDHRSLKEQGIEREPQIHLGAKVMEMEARGIQTRVGDESRRISQANRDRKRQQAKLEKLQAEIAAEPIYEPALSANKVTAVSHETALGQNQESMDSPLRSPVWLEGLAEALVEHQESALRAELFEAVARSGILKAVLDSTNALSARTEVIQALVDAKLRELQRAKSQPIEAQNSAPPVEKQQKPIKRQTPPRQKQRVKQRDQGMEM
jgi:ATP-dependent exoDNAse (exonuclease V) alpha subunit